MFVACFVRVVCTSHKSHTPFPYNIKSAAIFIPIRQHHQSDLVLQNVSPLFGKIGTYKSSLPYMTKLAFSMILLYSKTSSCIWSYSGVQTDFRVKLHRDTFQLMQACFLAISLQLTPTQSWRIIEFSAKFLEFFWQNPWVFVKILEFFCQTPEIFSSFLKLLLKEIFIFHKGV